MPKTRRSKLLTRSVTKGLQCVEKLRCKMQFKCTSLFSFSLQNSLVFSCRCRAVEDRFVQTTLAASPSTVDPFRESGSPSTPQNPCRPQASPARGNCGARQIRPYRHPSLTKPMSLRLQEQTTARPSLQHLSISSSSRRFPLMRSEINAHRIPFFILHLVS